MNVTYNINASGFYGEFGGAFVPEVLHRAVKELQDAYAGII